MTVNGWELAVPALTEMLLLGLCVGVALKLRKLQIGGVCELTLAAVMVDAVAQVWHMAGHVGRPAGAAWLVHVTLSYLMVYILYRLAELLCRVRTEAPACMPVRLGTGKEGGRAEWMRL
jgi:hypothetical protein